MDNDKNSIIDIVGDGINYEKLKKVEKSLCQIDIITEFMNRSRHLQGKKVNGCIMRIDVRFMVFGKFQKKKFKMD